MQYRETFHTHASDERARDGQPFEVIDSIETEDHPKVVANEIDIECLPMYEVRFPDGYTTHAFPEEVRTDWECLCSFTTWDRPMAEHEAEYNASH